jgi:hypothetical protein
MERGDLDFVAVGVEKKECQGNASIFRRIKGHTESCEFADCVVKASAICSKGHVGDTERLIQIAHRSSLRSLKEPDLEVTLSYEPSGCPLVHNLETEQTLVELEGGLETSDV